MTPRLRSFLALALALAMPATAIADPHGGGGGGGGGHPSGGGGGGGSRPAPSYHAGPPPPSYHATQPAPSGPRPTYPSGFNSLNPDIHGQPVQPYHAPTTGTYPGTYHPPVTGTSPGAYHPPATGYHEPNTYPGGTHSTVTYPKNYHPPAGGWTPPNGYRPAPPTSGQWGPYHGNWNGRPIYNPRYYGGGPWGWNRGVAWYPSYYYWGGGFWGGWAFAAIATALVYGAIVNANTQVYYPSYQVQAGSPGAQMLQAYELQQTQCGPPNLVVIWGPNNSVICAYPNALVSGGNYQLDPTTLTLVSQQPPPQQ